MSVTLRHTRRPIWLCGLLCLTLLGLGGCSTDAPEGVKVVSPFELPRYLGKWHEIARLDHSFERGLSDVSAVYRMRPDGGVEVVNRGYDTHKQQWKEAIGRAYFTGDSNTASLKVSFFGPFYGGYHVIALDQQHYAWSMVIGPDRDYLWILARDKSISAEVKAQLLKQAQALGVDTQKLIWVEQTRPDA